MHEMLMDDEPLRIGVLASPNEASLLRGLFPEAIWSHYESLEECSWWGEEDDVDLLVIDVTQLEGRGAKRKPGGLGFSGQQELLKSLGDRFPILLLLAPESPAAGWMELEGVAVLRKPVDASRLRASFAAQEERIRTRRLKRLFHEVATTFAMDLNA